MKFPSVPSGSWLSRGASSKNPSRNSVLRFNPEDARTGACPAISTPSMGDAYCCCCCCEPVIPGPDVLLAGVMLKLKAGLASEMALSRGRRRLSGSCTAAGLRNMLVSMSVQRVMSLQYTAWYHVSGTPSPPPVPPAPSPAILPATLREGIGVSGCGESAEVPPPGTSVAPAKLEHSKAVSSVIVDFLEDKEHANLNSS